MPEAPPALSMPGTDQKTSRAGRQLCYEVCIAADAQCFYHPQLRPSPHCCTAHDPRQRCECVITSGNCGACCAAAVCCLCRPGTCSISASRSRVCSTLARPPSPANASSCAPSLRVLACRAGCVGVVGGVHQAAGHACGLLLLRVLSFPLMRSSRGYSACTARQQPASTHQFMQFRL